MKICTYLCCFLNQLCTTNNWKCNNWEKRYLTYSLIVTEIEKVICDWYIKILLNLKLFCSKIKLYSKGETEIQLQGAKGTMMRLIETDAALVDEYTTGGDRM